MELERGERINEKFCCVADELVGLGETKFKSCGSSDALSVYEHELDDGESTYSAHCFSCDQGFSPRVLSKTSLGGELGMDNTNSGKVRSDSKPKKSFSKASKAEPATKEEIKKLQDETGYVSNNYRGIKDEYRKFFGHLTKLDDDGNVVSQYYPESIGKEIVGYKCRNHPKDFTKGKLGLTGVSTDLSGQIRFRRATGKYVVICGGEEDKVAAYQMLDEYQKSRGNADFNPIPVVSGTSGEGSLFKQLAAQYDWLDRFDNIVLGLDSDEAGRKALEKCCEVLPAEKILIATWSNKDPNEMLQKKRTKQFIRDFYNAKPYISTGIKGSGEIIGELESHLTTPKLTLPPFMHRLQSNMRGGIGFGRIVNLIADSSVGKTSIVNSMVYHWIMKCSDIAKVGIVSLESTAAEYALDMLSMHLGMNLQAIPDGGEVLQLLDTPEVKEKYDTLFTSDEGVPRFHIVDEREGKISIVEKQIERMVKQYGCNVIVIDVLSDLLRSLDNSEQERHMMWQKLLVKNGIIIIDVQHTRKPPADNSGKKRKATEYDAIGSSSFVQSAHINIVFNRDKMEEDPVKRNTTEVDMPKCRGGITGHACDWYYDWKTREMHDYEDYFSKNSLESVGGTPEDGKPKQKFSKADKPQTKLKKIGE